MSRLLLREHIDNAFQSLRTKRARSLLTTVGIAIGVASITTILALSGGVTSMLSDQVDRLGGNIAVVRPGYTAEQSSDFGNPLGSGSYGTSTLTEKDYTDLNRIPGVKNVAPLMMISGELRVDDKKPQLGTIIATTPSFGAITKLEMDGSGQFLDAVTDERTAVIGQQLAIDLFGTEDPVGQQFSLRGKIFTVIGALQRSNDPVNYNNIDLDRTAFINLKAGMAFHDGHPQIQQINLQAADASQLKNVTALAQQKLTQNHLGEKDFTIITGKEVAQPTSRLFQAFTGVMTAIAAISLVVGGIGIMNIMLVAVAERTREIGLRKAVGASGGQIIGQFLTEALIMSLIGGFIGYVGGYCIAFIVSTFLTFNPALTWQIAAIAFGISLVVGVIFGAYPALRAARKDAIESLRVYH